MGAERGDGIVMKARLDMRDHIVAADDVILQLQAAAGGAPDGHIAIPQVATVARLARRLGILIARPLLIGGEECDIRLWVRAKPVTEGVELEFSEWQEAPHAESDAIAAQRAAQISLVPDGVEWRTDEQMRFLHLGPEVSVAAPGDEFFAIFALHPAEDRKGFSRLVAEIASRRAFFGIVARLEHNARLVLLSGHPLFDADGAFLGYRGKFSFYDEEEAAPVQAPVPEPEVLARDSAQTEDSPSHTSLGLPDFGRRLDLALRQPLGRIIANAETIKGQMEGPLRTDYTSYAADIADAGRHLMELVDDLADLQAIDRVGFHVAQEPVDLADIARRAAGLLAVKAADRHIIIETPGQTDSMPVIGEFRRVLQIAVNLLTNAVRYSPEQSRVRIAVESVAQGGALIVCDQGKGIAPEDRDRVFEKFERLGRSDIAGSGLGLYISRRLARAMKGDISIETAPEGGACFRLILPTE